MQKKYIFSKDFEKGSGKAGRSKWNWCLCRYIQDWPTVEEKLIISNWEIYLLKQEKQQITKIELQV